MNRVLGIAAVPTMLCAALMAIYPAFAEVSKSAATRDNPEYFPVPRTAGTALPFSEAVKAGDLLYLSGQIGNMPGTLTLAAGGYRARNAPGARQYQGNSGSPRQLPGTNHQMHCVPGGHQGLARLQPGLC